MLRGEKVLLRAVQRADVERIAAWESEPETWRLADDAPYVPRTSADVLKAYDAGETMHVTDKSVPFVVQAGGEVVGGITLWGMDLHHRRAHLGITLAPHARGKGYGTDACRVLLRYAFLDRGLHRVQLETLASNAQAVGAYRRAGFVEEGVRRQASWVDGAFVDEQVMSVLAPEWLTSRG